MSEAMMAYPELRHPFQETPLHPEGCATVLYQGKRITLDRVGEGEVGMTVIPGADSQRKPAIMSPDHG